MFLLLEVLDDAGSGDDDDGSGGLLVLFVLLVSVFFSSTIYLDQSITKSFITIEHFI